MGIKLQPHGDEIIVQGYSQDSGAIYDEFQRGRLYSGLILEKVNDQIIKCLDDAKKAMGLKISFFKLLITNLLIFFNLR